MKFMGTILSYLAILPMCFLIAEMCYLDIRNLVKQVSVSVLINLTEEKLSFCHKYKYGMGLS